MREIWQDSFVEEGNLARNVSTLRKALGEDSKSHRYILTVPGRGYKYDE
jgi:DNA-binding winged helix-turn-helix (wHTH) protein